MPSKRRTKKTARSGHQIPSCIKQVAFIPSLVRLCRPCRGPEKLWQETENNARFDSFVSCSAKPLFQTFPPAPAADFSSFNISTRRSFSRKFRAILVKRLKLENSSAGAKGEFCDQNPWFDLLHTLRFPLTSMCLKIPAAIRSVLCTSFASSMVTLHTVRHHTEKIQVEPLTHSVPRVTRNPVPTISTDFMRHLTG